MKSARRIIAGIFVACTIAAGGAIASPPAASANTCLGVNSRQQVTYDTVYYKLNSCRAKSLRDAWSSSSDMWQFATKLSKNPATSAFSRAFAFQAWHNKAKLDKCIRPGTGIEIHEINGLIFSCTPQARIYGPGQPRPVEAPLTEYRPRS